MKDFELSISPVETYKAPQLPKKGSDNSALLKKLPSRWQKSAKVLACMGIVGTLALTGSGCRQAEPEARPHWGGGPVAYPGYVVRPTEQEVYGYNYTQTDYRPHWGGGPVPPFYVVYPTEQEILQEIFGNILTQFEAVYPLSQDILDKLHNLGYPYGIYSGFSEAELDVRIHHGGGGASNYVVHLTEQEAYGIIRARLEAVGLNFGATPPEFDFNDSRRALWWVDQVNLTLFDEHRIVGVAHLSWESSNQSFAPAEREFARLVEDAFAERTNITVGAIFTPGAPFIDRDRDFWYDPTAPSDDEIELLRPLAVDQLINQIDMFIFLLQSRGLVGQFPNIDIAINETSAAFSDYPILINNYVMVPALDLFEALGMNLVPPYTSERLTARKGDITILVSLSQRDEIPVMRVNHDWIGRDIPLLFHDNRIFVPLQFVARTIGADVEWDESAREIRINTR